MSPLLLVALTALAPGLVPPSADSPASRLSLFARFERPVLRLAEAQLPPPPPLPASVPAPTPAPQSYDVIRTKDGKVRVGRVLQETEKGYLFRTAEGETAVIAFGDIDDIQRTGGSTLPAQGSGHPGSIPQAGFGNGPQPAYPPAYNYDPLAVEKERKRLRLEATLRDLEAHRAELSYGTPIFELVSGAAIIALGLFVLDADPVLQVILLVSGGLNVIIGGVRLGTTLYDVSRIDDQIDATRAELAQPPVSLSPPVQRLVTPMVALARF